MTTTTISIDDDLKARIAAAAERAGKTAHAFMLEAIVQTLEQTELDDEFHRLAGKRWADDLATRARGLPRSYRRSKSSRTAH